VSCLVFLEVAVTEIVSNLLPARQPNPSFQALSRGSPPVIHVTQECAERHGKGQIGPLKLGGRWADCV
jgi:hypothetical protein